MNINVNLLNARQVNLMMKCIGSYRTHIGDVQHRVQGNTIEFRDTSEYEVNKIMRDFHERNMRNED